MPAFDGVAATYWKANIREIEDDFVVRAFGWAMLAGHATVWVFFAVTGRLMSLLDRYEPFCWPYFQECWKYRFHSASQIVAVLSIYAVLLLAAGVLLRARHIMTYWLCLSAVNVLLLCVVSLDYRLRSNEVYMLGWLNIVFLTWPMKRWSVPLIIVSFYFWAGMLKLNSEWLSAAALYSPLWLVPRYMTPAACAYVIVLELAISLCLLVKRRWIKYCALAQFALFHIESLSQIHWFYPALMATILSWFVIDGVNGSMQQKATLGALFSLKAPTAAYGVLAVFAAFQLAPRMYHGDRVLNGQGRLFALHMFEAKQMCDVWATVHYADASWRVFDLKLKQLPPRVVCDPIVYFDRVSNICRSHGVSDVDWVMSIRRTTDRDVHELVNEVDFCSKPHAYAVLGNNAWMH